MTGEYEEALAEMYSDVPDVPKSLHLLEAAHANGDARATYALATWYLHGKAPIIESNLAKAKVYLECAAEAGVAEALFDIGVAYEKGTFSEPDPRRAFESYLKAAIRGDAQSFYEVGRCYNYGIGVVADPANADIWNERAGELGISE